MHSDYDDKEAIARGVAQGRHRIIIGDFWDQIGRLQFDYLRNSGLKPESRLLDVGCGSLRGGVHFVAFLDPGHYFGIDSNVSLIDAGYNLELGPLGLQPKLPRANLIADDEFRFDGFPERFDFALAQSLFTHLPLNHLRLCLARLWPKMKVGSRFFATFFLMPNSHAVGAPVVHSPGGVTSRDWRDPYHYYVRDLAYAAEGLPWRMHVRGDWSHPRDQQMIEFERV